MDPISTAILTVKFNDARRGVSDPARLIAAELQNITEVLLQLLEETRRRK